jgi:hypothetical protein
LLDPVAWTVVFPRDNQSFREAPFSEKARQLLRFTEGANVFWEERDGTRFQAIFLRWEAGRTAVHFAKSHSPDVCLTAVGCEQALPTELVFIPVQGLVLPFRSYEFKGAKGPLHVFYCLWEDRHDGLPNEIGGSTYATRLRDVLAGHRNCGQRSLEIAVWGIVDREEAKTVLAGRLRTLIKLENSESPVNTVPGLVTAACPIRGADFQSAVSQF